VLLFPHLRLLVVRMQQLAVLYLQDLPLGEAGAVEGFLGGVVMFL
jgi:hypothetical protein